MAMERKIDAFTTTLTISPHKNSSHIFRIGRDVGREDGIRFMEYNFKKRDGFARSLVLSREHELYRQDYCGCRSSLRERKEREAKGTRVMNKKG